MNYKDVLINAKSCIGQYCKACVECNGKACKNQIPGPGAKGVGDTAIRNYDKWKEIRVNMDTLTENKPVDMSCNLFDRKFKYPFLAFTGDGTNPDVMKGATTAIKNVGGLGIPTIKPWNIDTIKEKIELVKKSNAIAVAMDIDAAGLPFLKNMNPPAGAKSVDELKEIIKISNLPFIVKGVMTVKGALKAKEAGAYAIVVSNHGGRVLDQCPSTAEVLEDIVKAVGDSMKVFVDGGIRSGVDVFKALALGADGVLICRTFVTALYGGEEAGVKSYIEKLASELEDTMAMCGAYSINEITRDMIRY